MLGDHALCSAPLHSDPFIDFTNISLDNANITKPANVQSNVSKNANNTKDNDILEVLENELNNSNVVVESSEDEVKNDE